MNDDDSALLVRASEIIARMPTMKNAAGCMDCDHVFKVADKCPVCGSGSVLNIAAILNNSVARRSRWMKKTTWRTARTANALASR